MRDEGSVADTTLLLDRVRREEEGAVDALIAHVLPDVTRFVRARRSSQLRSSFETMDCVQDVALGLIRYLPRLETRDGRTLRALLGRMVENSLCTKARWLNTRREELARSQPLHDDTRIDLDPADDHAETPSEALQTSERQAWIRVALALLGPDEQELIVRREFDEEPFDGIARDLGISVDAARMRARRARQHLAHVAGRLRRGEARAVLAEAAR